MDFVAVFGYVVCIGFCSFGLDINVGRSSVGEEKDLELSFGEGGSFCRRGVCGVFIGGGCFVLVLG